MIAWPLAYDSHELTEFSRALQRPEAFELWKQLQVEYRRQIEELKGIDSASGTYGSVRVGKRVKRKLQDYRPSREKGRTTGKRLPTCQIGVGGLSRHFARDH